MAGGSVHHVGSTFNRSLLSSGGGTVIRYCVIDAIRLVSIQQSADSSDGDAPSTTEPVEECESHISIRFQFNDARHQLNLFLSLHPLHKSSLNERHQITGMDCTIELPGLVRIEELIANSSAASSTESSQSSIFHIVDTSLRILYASLMRPIPSSPSTWFPSRSWLASADPTSAARWLIMQMKCFRPPSTHSSGAPAQLPLTILAQEFFLNLLSAAVHSGRSVSLVKPLPECSLPLSLVHGAASAHSLNSSNHSSISSGVIKIEPNVQNECMVNLERTFERLPALFPLFSHIYSSSTDSMNAAGRLESMLDAQASCLLAFTQSKLNALHLLPSLSSPSLSRLQPSGASVAMRDWYGLQSQEEHHIPEILSSLICPPPHFQFDVEIYDPYFDQLASPPSPSRLQKSKQQQQAHSSSPRRRSILVFHGSPLPNWYSIMQNGMESKSGTKEQSSGAIFGNGIYCTTDLRVARNFSKAAPTQWAQAAASPQNPFSQLGNKFEVVGVFELLLHEAGEHDSAPVRRAASQRSNTSDAPANENAVPDYYYVVRDNNFLKLKHLLVWRADGEHPPTLVFPSPTPSLVRSHSAPMTTTSASAAASSSPHSIMMTPSSTIPTATQDSNDGSGVRFRGKEGSNTIGSSATNGSLPVFVPMVAHESPPLWRRCRTFCANHALLLAYLCILLGIIAMQVDWTRWKNIVQYWWRLQQHKRF